MSTDYEIFNAAERNDAKKLKALLDAGMDPNIRDYDRGATPLHLAANKGNVEAIELLIDAGADVNAANKRGRTPIHALIEMRFYKIVLWLIKYCGGDPFQADSRGLTPYDLAQQFMQKEIDDCLKSIGKMEDPEKHAKAVEAATSAQKASSASSSAAGSSSSTGTKSDDSIVYRIHLPNRSYKSVRTTVHFSAEMVLESLCEKLNLEKDSARHLVLFERVKDRERKVKNTELIADIVKMWPMILGENGNETYKQCYFLAAPLSTAPDHVIAAINV